MCFSNEDVLGFALVPGVATPGPIVPPVLAGVVQSTLARAPTAGTPGDEGLVSWAMAAKVASGRGACIEDAGLAARGPSPWRGTIVGDGNHKLLLHGKHLHVCAFNAWTVVSGVTE